MERLQRTDSTSESRFRKYRKACLLVGSLLLASCAGPSGCSVSVKASSEKPMLVFDDLGGGDDNILVYPGASSSDADSRPNGIYQDGDAFVADCITTGRTVDSHPEVGETAMSSDKWVRFRDGAKVHFATAVYLENPGVLLAELSKC